MVWSQPITDRTILDIDKLQEYDEIGYQNLTEDQKIRMDVRHEGGSQRF